MIIDGSPCPKLVSISDALESISELDKYLFLIRVLATSSYIYLGWGHLVRVNIKLFVRVVLLQPVKGLLVLDTHISLLNYDDEDVHDYTTKEMI